MWIDNDEEMLTGRGYSLFVVVIAPLTISILGISVLRIDLSHIPCVGLCIRRVYWGCLNLDATWGGECDWSRDGCIGWGSTCLKG